MRMRKEDWPARVWRVMSSLLQSPLHCLSSAVTGVLMPFRASFKLIDGVFEVFHFGTEQLQQYGEVCWNTTRSCEKKKKKT